MKEIKIEYTNEYGDCDELVINETLQSKEMVMVTINYYDADMVTGAGPDMMRGYFEKSEIIKMAIDILKVSPLPHPTCDVWWFANGDYYVPVTVDIDGEVERIKAITPESEAQDG